MYFTGWNGTVKQESRTFDIYAMAYAQFYAQSENVQGYSPDPTALAKIKEKQNFDSGYDFTIVEALVYGEDLQPGPQNIGNCVGYSHCMLLASKIAHEIFVELQPEKPLATNTPIPYIPYSYGAGRVYVGGNRYWGDGSNCADQIQASMEHGFLPCDTPNLTGPFPQSTSTIGRQFGKSRSTLDKFHDTAINFDLVESTRITSVDEVRRFLTEVYSPLQICSSWGFRPSYYDNNRGIWIYKASGRWSHSMQLVGWISIKGEEFIHVRNQWGRDAHKNSTPVIPLGGFLISPDTMKSWLRSAYCASIGEIKGKAREKLKKFPF